MNKIEFLDFQGVIDNIQKIETMLHEVVDNDPGYTIETELQGLVGGQMGALIINDFEALTIVELMNTPVQRVCWLKWMVGKNMDKWLPDMLAYLEDFAKAQGCKLMEFNGRKGYMRKYGDLFPDYKITQIVVRKVLE